MSYSVPNLNEHIPYLVAKDARVIQAFTLGNIISTLNVCGV